ncbi:MAG TPA: sulfite exporter TauE/SafE family protein [Pyrinomonadaceae bacterium]|nr:sulfite exporter TauE/SafE family protein [Pyrinomonadaceae bacterium]
MFESTEILIVLALFIVAILYSSVGHGGASGYLAVMAFLSVAPNVTKPTALILNIFVASIATFQFYRRGFFDWKVFLPFAAASIPTAFLGGMISLPTQIYRPLLGAILLFAAFRLAWNFTSEKPIIAPSIWLALIIGAIIGFLSGLVGVGGGIFLTPVLLLTNWTETKKAAGISAMFILVNSISGLLGSYAQVGNLPANVWFWIAAAILGGTIGSTLGSKYFNSLTLRRVLAFVLLIASFKMFFT